MRKMMAEHRKISANSTFSQNEFMIRNKSNEPSGNSISFVDGQMAAISNGSFQKIFDGLRNSFRVTRKIENDALQKFAKDFESLFRDSLSTAREKNSKMKFAMESLRVQNNKMESENKKLEQKISYLVSAQQKLQFKLGETQQRSVSKSSLKKCESNLVYEKQKYQAVFPNVQRIKESFQSIKSTVFLKLIQAYKAYRNRYKIKVQAENKRRQSIGKFKLAAKRQLNGFKKLEKLVTFSLGRQEGCTQTHKNLSLTWKAANRYKSLLFSQRDDLRFCQSQHSVHKKLLSSSNNFFLYLLKRLSQIGEGIRHLKIVGERLRWRKTSFHWDQWSFEICDMTFRTNLIGAQSRLGQCRGSLQGLRHECEGLVNWYQSVPGQGSQFMLHPLRHTKCSRHRNNKKKIVQLRGRP